jgi:hypothetical protein
MDPALMQQMLFGGGQGGGLGSLGSMGSPPPPADTRPAEERFQVQLQVCNHLIILFFVLTAFTAITRYGIQ